MYHHNRRWCVTPVESIHELVDKLLRYSWCCCAAFELDGHVWLNDSTSADALQEYAVVRRPTEADPVFRQVESITVSWCDEPQLTELIESIHRGALRETPAERPVAKARAVGDLFAFLGASPKLVEPEVRPRLETVAEHGQCGHCA